jgi:ribosomal protein L37E
MTWSSSTSTWTTASSSSGETNKTHSHVTCPRCGVNDLLQLNINEVLKIFCTRCNTLIYNKHGKI